MKKNKEINYKVDVEDVMQRYNVSEELREEIEARVRRANRKSSIPKSALERRSRSMQLAYAFIKKLDSTLVQELLTLANRASKVLKHHSHFSKEFEKIDQEIDKFCIRIGAAKERHIYLSSEYYTDYNIPKDALLSVVTSFTF